jgi:hypothetical protein
MRLEDRSEVDEQTAIDEEHEERQDAWRRAAARSFAQQASQEAAQATIAAIRDMFTSEPLPGVQSPFYAGARYYASEEDARRARALLTELAEIDAQLTAMGEAAAARIARRVA